MFVLFLIVVVVAVAVVAVAVVLLLVTVLTRDAFCFGMMYAECCMSACLLLYVACERHLRCCVYAALEAIALNNCARHKLPLCVHCVHSF